KPKASPVGLRLSALEPLENPLLVGGRDPGAFIGNADQSPPIGPTEAQADGSPLGRMTDRVADQIDEDLDDGPFLTACAQRTASVRLDRHAPVLNRGFEHDERFRSDAGEVD